MLQTELALAAHGGPQPGRRPRIDLSQIETPGLTGWDRWLRIAEIVGERSARFADAAFVKKLARTYCRAEHLPHIGIALDWQPGFPGDYYAAMRPEAIIVLLRGAIMREARQHRATGTHFRNRTFRTLVKRAYCAERLAVLRQRAAKRVAA